MSGGMWIAIVSASLVSSCIRIGRIFLFGRMWQSCNEKASYGQIVGSDEVTFDTLLGKTVLFLPVKRLRAVTSYRHPR